MLPILYIIIPCYNEEKVLPITSGMFLDKIRELVDAQKISDDSRILFVNDGSKDRTWEKSLPGRIHTLLESVKAATGDIRMQCLPG